MASRRDLESAQIKLKMKSELLKAKVAEMEAAEKRRRLKQQLSSMGGRVRV